MESGNAKEEEDPCSSYPMANDWKAERDSTTTTHYDVHIFTILYYI